MNLSAIRALFERLRDVPGSQRRAIYETEGIDPAVRAEVEALLAHDVTDDPIGTRIGRAAAVTLDAVLPERIGAYRVLGVIGEGGMGTVLRGERDDGAYAMTVAIKLIRGFASAGARERFVRERQVLAVLDHPNIAGLVDGGTTPGGEPYLVMPYVQGDTLAEWVARAQPSLDQRLQLFLALCDAVHYAHQHLVVHRDLKPGNILVRPDGSPVLLDFGIAKLLEPGGRDDATGTRLMTPRYASPEQLLGRPMTTATDIHGLGLVLYELLAGTVPERGDAIAAASTELPPPSRLAATSEAFRHDTRRIRGDLDKIVRRAVRSEPAARYPSALALAEDVKAYREGRPVQAAGRHWSYLAGKFIRRHRLGVAAATLALSALVAFAWQLRVERDRARDAQAQATREADAANAVTDFLVKLFAELDPDAHPGRQLSARELLDLGRTRVDDVPAARVDLRARLQESLGWIYANAGDPAAAIALLEPAQRELDAHGTPAARVRNGTTLARAYNDARRHAEALAAAIAAEELAARALPDDWDLRAHAAMVRGVAEGQLGRRDVAQASFERAQAWFERAGSTADLGSVMHNRAWLAEMRNDFADALQWYDRALAVKRAAFPPDHPKVLTSLHGRGKALAELERLPEAADVFVDLLQRTTRVYGPRGTRVGEALNEIASTYQDLGRYADSQRYYERAIAQARELAGGVDDASNATAINNLGTLLEERGDVAGAEQRYRDSLALRSRFLPAGHVGRAVPAHNLARLYLGAGRVDEARAPLADALALRRAGLAYDHPNRLATELLAAQLAIADGDVAAAAATIAAADAAMTRNAASIQAIHRAMLAETKARLAATQGDPATARRWQGEAVAQSVRGLVPDHPRVARAVLLRATYEHDVGDDAAARASIAAAAPILRHALVPDAPVLRDLAALEAALGGR